MDWLAFFISVIGIFLNAKKKISCWYFWMGSSVLWALFCYKTKQYPMMLNQSVFLVMNVYGLVQWKKEKKLCGN
jgi:nicotinamide riboside transporter PnuC